MDVASANDPHAVVAAVARALDADDLAAAGALLAEDCVYASGRGTHHGRAAILASYAEASAFARRAFDEVRYQSEVGPPEGRAVPVTFIDYLLKAGGRWHTYRCRQVFTVTPDGRISHIVHHELPGEHEALESYFRACGIER